MMKIALWGYGKYGRRMFESLTRFCSEEYDVVRVYDTAYRKLKYTEGELVLPIHNPEKLTEDYKNKLFEAVLICIFPDVAARNPQKILKDNSIPELHLGHPDDFYPISSFEQGIKPFEINQDGYDFYVAKNICGAMANYESNELLYLFDSKGRVLKEHWEHWSMSPEDSFVYDYPYKLDNTKVEKLFLKGQYCILTKKFAGNYWHFTYQCVDSVWLLEKAGYKGFYIVPNQSFCSEILSMLDIAPERIITLDKFEHNKEYIFEEVFYVMISGVKKRGYDAMVLKQMAEYIKKKLPEDPSLPKKIYVKRIGKRKLLGADDLLAEYGFTTIIPEDYSVKDQMKLFYNADIVFCVHGANSTNCLYMRKDTVFIEAFSSYWINRCNLNTLFEIGIHYLPVSPLETVWENRDGMFKDFRIPKVMLQMSIQNAFLIFQAQHESASSKLPIVY